MAGAARRRTTATLAILSSALVLAGCGLGGRRADHHGHAPAAIRPVHIVPAPGALLAAAQPQADGTMWALAGNRSIGLFRFDASSGHAGRSMSVSAAARWVAESSAGILGLALGTTHWGALELLSARTGRVIKTIALPAPAREVAAGGDGLTFYVLTGWAASASVTVVSSRTGRIQGTVPVPADAVSVAPDTGRGALYVLQRNGLVDKINVSGGPVAATFSVGDGGKSIALSPDGSTLYVLKGTSAAPDIAVVTVGTESVRDVLPAPRHCLQLLLSPAGTQLYEAVGTPGYGNIQVFAL